MKHILTAFSVTKPSLDGLGRLREDQAILRESCLGLEDLADWARNKKTKPRAVRDWEQSQGR